MKRSFLYLAAGALALSACTSESVIEDVAKSQNVIGFENIVDKLSRVDGLDATNLKQFYVYGYYTTPFDNSVAVPVFENVEVKKDVSGNWTYDGGNRFWVPDAHYYFYAYSCGNAVKLNSTYGNFTMSMDNGQTPDNRVLTINNYLCDNTHQHDLIFASNTGATESDTYAGIVGKESGNAPVALKFKHILSKVKAQFTSSFPAGYTVEISNVRINNFHNVGTYNPSSANGWQGVKHEEGNVSPQIDLMSAAKTTTVGEDPVMTDEAYVIPYQYQVPTAENNQEWVYINFNISVKNKGKIVFEKSMKGHFSPSWLNGYTYTYNIDLNGDAANLQIISFTTVTGEDWITSTETTSNTITIEP